MSSIKKYVINIAITLIFISSLFFQQNITLMNITKFASYIFGFTDILIYSIILIGAFNFKEDFLEEQKNKYNKNSTLTYRILTLIVGLVMIFVPVAHGWFFSGFLNFIGFILYIIFYKIMTKQ